MRRSLVVLAGFILAVLAAGASYAAFGGSEGGSVPATTTAVPQGGLTATRPPVLAALGSAASAPDPAQVAARLGRLSDAAAFGHVLDAEVTDVATGTVLWQHGATRAAPPASTAKLLTATAALSALGPQHRLLTTVRRRGHTIWLVGGNDVTLAADPAAAAAAAAHDAAPGDPASVDGDAQDYPRPATLSALAARTVRALRAAGMQRVRLGVDAGAQTGPALAPGWKASYLSEGDVAPPSALEVDEGRTSPAGSARVADPTAVALHEFATDLDHDGIAVTVAADARSAPDGSRRVAAVASPPIAQLVQLMLTNSDDDLAEALARSVAVAQGAPGSYRGAAGAVMRADRDAGVDVRHVSLVDGSGLSPLDRVTPAALISVLRLATTTPALAAIGQGLPVAGFSGTLAQRYRAGPQKRAAGVVRAKTGTLATVSALAGFVADRSGDLLAFALQVPASPDVAAAETDLDRITSALAACGCRAGQ
jgi:D-alanyl-D-alanine carboxypeptidase/D-alanyl-D-alanine-endopeptidase (penicillin-binding protein 4)